MRCFSSLVNIPRNGLLDTFSWSLVGKVIVRNAPVSYLFIFVKFYSASTSNSRNQRMILGYAQICSKSVIGCHKNVVAGVDFLLHGERSEVESRTQSANQGTAKLRTSGFRSRPFLSRRLALTHPEH